MDSMVRAIQNYYMLYLLLGLGVTALVILIMRRVIGPKKVEQTEMQQFTQEQEDRKEGKS